MKIMGDLIDIHSHILPGFDDGPEDIEQSIEAARRYKDIGVNCVIATPHRIDQNMTFIVIQCNPALGYNLI